VLDILESEEFAALKDRLDAHVRQLTSGLHAQECVVLGGLTPIVSVLVGDEETTLRAGRALFDCGFYVQSVIFPAVPYREGVLRIQVNANHTPEMVAGLLDAIADVRKVIPFPRMGDQAASAEKSRAA
jgi:7-keto-8-aminopelargonate synthetase-like enzyme